MLLLFTLIPNEKNVGKKLIFRYDTEKKEHMHGSQYQKKLL